MGGQEEWEGRRAGLVQTPRRPNLLSSVRLFFFLIHKSLADSYEYSKFQSDVNAYAPNIGFSMCAWQFSTLECLNTKSIILV